MSAKMTTNTDTIGPTFLCVTGLIVADDICGEGVGRGVGVAGLGDVDC